MTHVLYTCPLEMSFITPAMSFRKLNPQERLSSPFCVPDQHEPQQHQTANLFHLKHAFHLGKSELYGLTA
jgi:hypothetical protein